MFFDIDLLTDTNIYLFFLIIPFFVQLGIFPIGLMFFIITAGVLSENINQIIILFFIILFSTSLGDISAYLIAKYFGKSKFMKFLLNKNKFKKIYFASKLYVEKRGAITIFLTRFLISGIGPYINYIVGLHKYSFKKFVKYVVLGEILYAIDLLLIGYLFKDSLNEYSNYIYFGFLIILIIYILHEIHKYIIKIKIKLRLKKIKN